MRRRLDITPLPFLQPDGRFYSLAEGGALIPYVPDDTGSLEAFGGPSGGPGADLELTSTSMSVLKNHQDYVARARYIAEGSKTSDASEGAGVAKSATEIKRTINKLSRAVSELRIGILGKSIHYLDDVSRHSKLIDNPSEQATTIPIARLKLKSSSTRTTANSNGRA